MTPDVVQHAHFRRVEKLAGRRVHDEGVIGPAVPQSRHDVEELAGAVVAAGVGRVVGQPEVASCVRVLGRDHVPARPASAEVVKGGEATGDVERLVVGRRGGRDQPDPARDGGQRGQKRVRVE